jgi:hypothetical protein
MTELQKLHFCNFLYARVWNRVHSASWVQLRSYLNGKVAAPGLENRDYGRGDPLHWPRDTLYQLKLALTSPTDCGRSVSIVRLRTKTTESLVYEPLAIWREVEFSCLLYSPVCDVNLMVVPHQSIFHVHCTNFHLSMDVYSLMYGVSSWIWSTEW